MARALLLTVTYTGPMTQTAMSSGAIIDRADLFSQKDGSNKEYHVTLERSQDGADAYVVNYTYGPRGGTLRGGTKTKTPLPLASARKLFDKIVAGQYKDGYQDLPASGEAIYIPPATTLTVLPAGISGPQLATPIDRAELDSFCADDDYYIQPKEDGERRGYARAAGVVTATNRLGNAVAYPKAVADALAAIPGDLQLDGEQVGPVFKAFDLLADASGSLVGLPLKERLARLEALLAPALGPALHLVPVARTAAEKRALCTLVEREGGEGVVAKRADAPYTPGKPARGGDWRKCKYTESATVRVHRHNPDRRSVVMTLRNTAGAWVEVGSVAIPSNHQIPAPEALIEVNYLYAYREGALFQPVYRGERSDLLVDDCTLEQLKYKADAAA